jgi:hypothetical protein
VTNLEPATIRGVRSEGMLLAAEEGKQLALLTPEKDLPAGALVNSGMEPGQKILSFKEFQKLELRVGAVPPGQQNTIDLGPRKVRTDSSLEPSDSGRKFAVLVAGDKGLVMRSEGGVRVTLDRDIPAGAKIR